MSRQLLSECVRSLSQPRSQEASRKRISGLFDDGQQPQIRQDNNQYRQQRASSVSIANNNNNNNTITLTRDPTTISVVHAQPITNPQEQKRQQQQQQQSQQYPFPSSKAAISQEDCNLDIESSCDLSASYAQIDSPLAVANHRNIIYNQVFKSNVNAQQFQKSSKQSSSITATPPITESANPLNIPCFKVDKTLSALSSRTSHPQELSQPQEQSIQPSSISNSLSNRTVFSFTRQQAVSFPKEIEQRCVNLQILDISENRFKTLPNEIASFRQLKKLNLNSNFIKTLPAWLFEILSLQELKVSNNLLSDLPSNLSNQTNLQVLDLNKNRITSIPHAIGSLRNLQSLNIACNDFTTLPSSMRFLLDSQLSKLTLDWFKYCNPPLSATQSSNDNHLQLFQPGQEVISPMKKLSQLLFRAEEKQKNISNTTRSSSTNACNNSENQDNSNIPSFLKVPVLLSSKKQSQQRPLSDRNHYVLSDRSSFQPDPSGAFSHRNSRRDSSPYVPLNASSMSSADTSFVSCNYSSIPVNVVPGLFEKMNKPIPILRDLSSIPTFGQLQSSACDYSFCQFLQEMSTKQFNPEIKLENNVTLLHVAAASEDLGAIEGLNQLNPYLKDTLDDKQFSALAVAINEEKYFAAKKLLKLGANPSIGGGIFGTPLNIATIKGQIFLLADILSKEDLCVNTPDADGNTSIHYIMTVYSRDFESSEKILKMLLESGCNPNVKNLDGWTPLHLAIRRSQFAAVQFAIQYNKRKSKGFDRNPKQIDGMYQKHPQNLQFFDFLAKGGDMKQSCLHISCLHNDVRMTKMLLESNEVDFFAMNNLNQTAANLPPKGNMLSKYLKKYQKEMLETELLKPSQQLQQSKSQQIFEQPLSAPKITKPIIIDQRLVNHSMNGVITSPKEQALGFNFKRKILIFQNKLEQKQPSSQARLRQINHKEHRIGSDFNNKEQLNQELSCTDTEDDNCDADEDAYSRDTCPEDSQATAPTDFDEHNHIKDIKSSKSGNLPSQIRTNEIATKNSLIEQTQRQQLQEYHRNHKLQIEPRGLISKEVELHSRKENNSLNSNGQNIINISQSNSSVQQIATADGTASYCRSSCSASGILNKLIFCRQRTLPSDEQTEQKQSNNQKIDVIVQNNNNNYHLAVSRMKKRKTNSAMYHFVNGTNNNNSNTTNIPDGNTHQVVKYITGDEDNRMLMIPKLQGEINYLGVNQQIEMQKTVENILSVFESGAFQYKSSLEQSVMSVSEQFQQVFYLLKLYTQTSYQMMLQQINNNGKLIANQIFQSNQMRMQQKGNVNSDIIINKMIGTLKELLGSLNATPLDYFTLMQFVENKDQINNNNNSNCKLSGVITNNMSTQIKQDKQKQNDINSTSITNTNNKNKDNTPSNIDRPATSRISMKSNSIDSNPKSSSSEDSPANSQIALHLPFSNWSQANYNSQISSPGDSVREYLLSSLVKIAPLSSEDIPVIDTLEQTYCSQGIYSKGQQLSQSSVILAFECFQARACIISKSKQTIDRLNNPSIIKYPEYSIQQSQNNIPRNGSFSARGHSDSLDHYDTNRQRLNNSQQQQQIQTARDIVNHSCDITTTSKQQIQLKLIQQQQQQQQHMQQMQQLLQVSVESKKQQQQQLIRNKQQQPFYKDLKGSTSSSKEDSQVQQNSTACTSNNLSLSFSQHPQFQHQQQQRPRVYSNPTQTLSTGQPLVSSRQQTSQPQSSASPYFLNLVQLPPQLSQQIIDNSSQIYSKPNTNIPTKPPRPASNSNIREYNSKENDNSTIKDNSIFKKESITNSNLTARVYRSNSITHSHNINNNSNHTNSNSSINTLNKSINQ